MTSVIRGDDGFDSVVQLKSGTAVSASGTSVDFTGIPSWVKRITISAAALSSNGTSGFILQLGDSGGIETSGYQFSVGSRVAETFAATTYFGLNVSTVVVAATNYTFQIVITQLNSATNHWVASWHWMSSAGDIQLGAGNKALSGILDRVRITTAGGTDTFDAGTINILYE